MPFSISQRSVLISYCCPECGRQQTVRYTHPETANEWERDFGDLPDCGKRCAVPYPVMDAIASWLDELVASGAGTEREPDDEC